MATTKNAHRQVETPRGAPCGREHPPPDMEWSWQIFPVPQLYHNSYPFFLSISTSWLIFTCKKIFSNGSDFLQIPSLIYPKCPPWNLSSSPDDFKTSLSFLASFCLFFREAHKLLVSGRVHPQKTNECPLKRDYFKSTYIFQPWIFRGEVLVSGFREGIIPSICARFRCTWISCKTASHVAHKPLACNSWQAKGSATFTPQEIRAY